MEIKEITGGITSKKVALYCRLSQDDGREGQSNSISNQKNILITYAQNNGFHNTEYFVDDGFSGTTFNRPGFQKMQQMVEAGAISTIIVKDLSRFGRNYLEVGNYLEITYPTMGVRFIAIQENIDTFLSSSTELMPFSNIFNEWYASQTSKKIRAVHQQRSKDGKRVGASVPYGYQRDPQNRDVWHIDEEAATVVRRVFSLCLEGYGPTKISRILEAEKVPTPTAYRIQKGRPANHELNGDPYFWQGTTVAHILDNMQYTGCTVNFMTTKVSYKINKKKRNNQDDWVIIPQTQPAIIDENTFCRVQQLRKNRHRCTKTGETSLFSNIIFCADCGAKLHFCASRKKNGVKGYFRCSQYKSGRGKCSSHYIRDAVLMQIVTESIRRLADFARCYEPVFLYLITKQKNVTKDAERKQLKNKLNAAKRRIEELDKFIQKAYEDNIIGKISDERYEKIVNSFESEQREHILFVNTYEDKIATMEQDSTNLRHMLNMLRSCLDITELTPTMVNTLIERIEIHDDDKKGKGKKVRVDIYYTAIGLTHIPSEEEITAAIKDMSNL